MVFNISFKHPSLIGNKNHLIPFAVPTQNIFAFKQQFIFKVFLNKEFWSIIIQQNGDFVFQMFRSEEHTSELQSRPHLVCRLLLEKKKKKKKYNQHIK